MKKKKKIYDTKGLERFGAKCSNPRTINDKNSIFAFVPDNLQAKKKRFSSFIINNCKFPVMAGKQVYPSSTKTIKS